MQFSIRDLTMLMFVGLLAMCCFALWPAEGLQHPTGREFDIAIHGRGFFQVQDIESGRTYYTRAGHFYLDQFGCLAVGPFNDRMNLEPLISIPMDYVSISISRQGAVEYTTANNDSWTTCGSIMLATFSNEDGLREVLPGIYATTDASGAPLVGGPGDVGGILRQGWREEQLAPNVLPNLFVAVLAVFVAYLIFEMRGLRKRVDELLARSG